MTFDAILPAGGRIDPEFAKVVGTEIKALIELGGETILGRTIRVLRESGRIDRIMVVGGEEVRSSEAAKQADYLLEEGTSAPDNILRGLKVLMDSERSPDRVVVATTDLPFLTPELVNRFIDSCPVDRAICVPLVNKPDWDSCYPNSTSTFVTLKDGTFTTGCTYLMDVHAMERARGHFERIFAVRKSKVGMAKLLGLKFLIKFATKQLTVPDLERKIQDVLGCTGAAIRNSPPELAYDIDFLDDYEYALKHLDEVTSV